MHVMKKKTTFQLDKNKSVIVKKNNAHRSSLHSIRWLSLVIDKWEITIVLMPLNKIEKNEKNLREL